MTDVPIAAPEMGEREIERVREVMASGRIADGPEVRAFEDEFAAFCETDYAVATSNGTTALHAALEAVGVGEGDKVVTTPFSFVASANAIRLAGAEPVFADIDPDTFNLDPTAVEEAIRREYDVAAVVPVHLYGLPAEMDRLLDVADEYDLAVVEDAAQAHGAAFDGRTVGSFGDAACFSMYPTKNMTTGEGGMITTDREDVAERAASFVNHGRPPSGGYEHVRVGHNFRMTSMAAAIGRVQLDRLPDFNEARRSNAAALTDALADADVVTPTEPDDRRHVYHQYTIRTDDRDGLADHLADEGVGTGVYYPTPIHEQPAYDGVSHTAPVAERTAEQALSLPVHPNVSEDDLRTITAAIQEYER
ncbi:DegT/DnrJ/EryC1/StrS aminotransferase family protein [Halorussus sp. MSC15.2]|uniref:DegT/DnrJ/EryC1/StrS family aminotransferase n=1 Tax=Halorussus sp. MSC15.2 TaxID=2283638 RepID=UPI0013CF8870|nr:DegT/DnrJ/EryC1/StrS family aminotransferase [Halorussus sp. MSC15.2]NEU56509.1 DegT/DnrJ/EryC1/StrS family aminotransferase [Halorussus sp. MSC15.2]